MFIYLFDRERMSRGQRERVQGARCRAWSQDPEIMT